MVTTREALQTEETILAAVDKGRGSASPVVSAEAAPGRLQDAAERPLNPGQLAAATMILSSPDRSVVVQGVAGAGKSTMLQAVARVARSEEHTSELQSLMRNSYAVFCLTKKKKTQTSQQQRRTD